MTTEATLHISGYVKNRENKPVPGLRVEAWDKDLFFDDFLAEAITDAEGRFMLTFPEERFRELFFDKRPDLYFKVRKGSQVSNEVIADTLDSVLWNVASGVTELEEPIIVDLPVAEEPEPEVSHRFIGRLLNDESGEPLSGYTVRAYDLDAGEEPAYLGYDITNTQGLFTVTYTTPAPTEDEEQDERRHLRLQILGQDGETIYETDIEIVVDSTDIVDIRVPQGVLEL